MLRALRRGATPRTPLPLASTLLVPSRGPPRCAAVLPYSHDLPGLHSSSRVDLTESPVTHNRRSLPVWGLLIGPPFPALAHNPVVVCQVASAPMLQVQLTTRSCFSFTRSATSLSKICLRLLPSSAAFQRSTATLPSCPAAHTIKSPPLTKLHPSSGL